MIRYLNFLGKVIIVTTSVAWLYKIYVKLYEISQSEVDITLTIIILVLIFYFITEYSIKLEEYNQR